MTSDPSVGSFVKGSDGFSDLLHAMTFDFSVSTFLHRHVFCCCCVIPGPVVFWLDSESVDGSTFIFLAAASSFLFVQVCFAFAILSLVFSSCLLSIMFCSR